MTAAQKGDESEKLSLISAGTAVQMELQLSREYLPFDMVLSGGIGIEIKSKTKEATLGWEEASHESHFDRVGKQLKSYDRIVSDQTKRLTQEFYLNLVWAIVVLFFVGIGIVYSNLAGLVSALGLGTVSFVGKASDLVQSCTGYINDKGILELDRKELQMRFDGCSHTDDACLDGIRDKIYENIRIIRTKAEGKQGSGGNHS